MAHQIRHKRAIYKEVSTQVKYVSSYDCQEVNIAILSGDSRRSWKGVIFCFRLIKNGHLHFIYILLLYQRDDNDMLNHNIN